MPCKVPQKRSERFKECFDAIKSIAGLGFRNRIEEKVLKLCVY